MIGKFVIVRTRNAGVHCGILRQCHGTAVELADARRIWRWRGANSIHELSLAGAAKDWTRISKPVDAILLTEAIEVIPCTADAEQNLRQSRWGS